jgi:hypothetical protein
MCKSIGYHHCKSIQIFRVSMAILFIGGVNDLSTVSVRADAKGNLAQILDGNCPLFDRVPLKKDAAGFLVLFGKGVKQPGVSFAEPPSLMVNQIANADTHRGSLERCAELCEQVEVTVINRPGKVLQTTRDMLSKKLQGIPGVIMPRTIRIRPTSPEDVYQQAAAGKIALPFIVRVADSYAGSGKVLIQSENEGDHLNVFPLDGRDFYLTQYIDCSDHAGLHHHQRIIVIDGEPVLRRAMFDSSWNVTGRSRNFMLSSEDWAQDRARLESFETEILPALANPISEITNRLNLEYFCIDCNVRPDGEMVVFTASANPDALVIQHSKESERIKQIHQKIQTMLARHSGEVVI